MCQRVMVAMGIIANANVLIADEPTSSLDLTTQASILGGTVAASGIPEWRLS
ncbi:MAG: hypothetical protein ACLSHM_01220 [Vescimonas sp.]